MVAERPQPVLTEAETQLTPMEQVSKTLGAVAQAYMNDPQKLMDAQMQLWNAYGQLWQAAWAKALGQPSDPVASPARNDKRFKDKDWQENTVFDFLKQFYLISANWAQQMVENAEALTSIHARHKAKFYVEQIANAVSPTNFAFTNPEVLRTTLASNGANLIEGLKHLAEDMKTPDGRLRIKQTDMSAFEIGRNIAMTPGKVVFRNETFELIQYSPTQAQTYEIPLVIFPPWINKFYILDLNPKKSFVKWAVDQGLTVFIVSWVNADEPKRERASRITCARASSKRSRRRRMRQDQRRSTSLAIASAERSLPLRSATWRPAATIASTPPPSSPRKSISRRRAISSSTSTRNR